MMSKTFFQDGVLADMFPDGAQVDFSDSSFNQDGKYLNHKWWNHLCGILGDVLWDQVLYCVIQVVA